MSSAKPAARRPRTPRRPVETDLDFTWGRTNGLLLGLGVAALVTGYIALARGSVTLAPILLIAGYCGLIPASLLWRRPGGSSGE